MKKKKNLLLKKLAVIFAAAFLVVQLVSCGDDDPLKGTNAGHDGDNGTPPPTGNKSDLETASKDVSGTFTVADLDSIDTAAALGTKVDSLNAKLSINTKSGRAESSTRLVVIIAQDMFGNDLSNKVFEATKNVSKDNMVVIVGGKGQAPGKFNTAYASSKFKGSLIDSGTPAALNPTVTSYATLQQAALKLFKVDSTSTGTPPQVQHHAIFGKLVYDDTTDVYASLKTKLTAIIKSLAQVAPKIHANNKDIAIIALDPFMSTLAIDVAADSGINTANSKITTVAALAPIMEFSSEGTDSAVNISYSSTVAIHDTTVLTDALLNEAKTELKETIARKHAFDALRRDGGANKAVSFFASLVNGVTTHNLSSKSSSKISGVKFHIATVEKNNAAAVDSVAGTSLILDENASDANHGLKAIVDPATDVAVTSVSAADMGGDANFPTGAKVGAVLATEPFKSAFKQ